MKKDLLFGLVCIIVLSLGGYCFAQYLEDEPITDVETSRVRDATKIYFLLDERRIVIKTAWIYLDSEDNIVRTEPAEAIELKDQIDDPETEEDETLTQFTDLMTELGVSKSDLKNAIKAVM